MRPTRFASIVALLALVAAGAPASAQPSSTTTTTTTTTAPDVDPRYRGFGDGGGFLNILPPGQNAGVTEAMLGQIDKALKGEGEFPPHYVDQLEMYEALIHAGELDDDALTNYFKDASFGVPDDDIDQVYSPHDDVVVIRDKSFGVPHIYGVTRYSTMFAQGYTTAEDRMFFMDVLRHVGRGRLAELIGYSDSFIGRDKGTVGSSPYQESDLTAQVELLADSGAEGASIVADVEAYADGVNAYMEHFAENPEDQPIEYKLLGIEPAPWIPEDAIAIATLVGGIFGRGGGREVENFCGLERLETALDDEATARATFDDLHFVDDDRVVTTDTPADYHLGRPDSVEPAAQPDIDCSSLQPLNDASPSVADVARGLGSTRSLLAADGRWAPTVEFLGSLTRAQRDGAHLSNAILIGGDRTKVGRPIAVFGPQIGYSAPELLTEKDVHGPGIDARGVGFLGVDFYVLLGRGDRYAWSATSSGADNVDQIVLERCSTAATGAGIDVVLNGYQRGAECVEFETWDHTLVTPATPLAEGGAKTITWSVERSEYGPVLWHGATKSGTPIAIVERRSTYGREVTSAIGFKRLNDPQYMEPGVDRFREAVGEGIDYTFNWFYVDDRDIAMQDSCRCPRRAEGVDPALPALAGGGYDWADEYLTGSELPHVVNPDTGFLVNWNNRPSAGWGSSDAEFSYGPVHRSQLLSNQVAARLEADVDEKGAIVPTIERFDVVTIMRNAANQDMRGNLVVPKLLMAMGEPPGEVDPLLLDLRERLEVWSDAGAYRRDLDGDGRLDDAVSPAIVDAWWPRISEEIFGDDGDPRVVLGLGDGHLDDSSSAASAIIVAIEGTGSFDYCSSANCRDELWAALANAADDLTVEFSTAEPESWQRTVADDEIVYSTLLAGMPVMHWQNRPTFQQVVQLESERDRPTPSTDAPVATGSGPTDRTGDDVGADGAGTVGIIVGVVALAAIVAFAIWRQRRRTYVRRTN
jgi:acyl-homoserine lactone acylase PvdQ